jgi:hypothetical protein
LWRCFRTSSSPRRTSGRKSSARWRYF